MKIDRHHKFPQTKANLKKYGRGLIDDPRNVCLVNHDLHMAGDVPTWNEREFCGALGLLREEYCERSENGCKSCTWYYGFEADECRNFEFSLDKYEEAQR